MLPPDRGFGLVGIFKLQSPLAAVPQQCLEDRQGFWGADDQNFADASQHQHGERVIDHGFIVHRQELLTDRSRQWIQARASPPCQDDALHGFPPRSA